MVKNHPLIWIILLAGVVILMSNCSWVDLASFSILVLASIISIWKWGYPRLKSWKTNRVYSLFFTESSGSQITDKPKAINIGKQDIFILVKMKSKKYLSHVSFHFTKGDNGGYTDASIISFENFKVNPVGKPPDIVNLEVHKQSVGAYFVPVRLLQKEDVLILTFTIDAKSTWCGQLQMEASDENGQHIYRSLEFNIVDFGRLTPDKKGCQT